MPEPKREPVNFQFQHLNWNYIKGLALIAQHAAEKYGSTEQYTEGRLVGEKSPINHAFEHLRQFLNKESHDKFGHYKWHLVSAGYNLMMEFFYEENFGGIPYPVMQQHSAIELPLDEAFKVSKSVWKIRDNNSGVFLKHSFNSKEEADLYVNAFSNFDCYNVEEFFL